MRVTGSLASSSGVTVNTATFDAAATQTVKALTVNSGGTTTVSAGVLTVGDNVTPAPLTLDGVGGSAKIDLTTHALVVDTPAGAAESAALVNLRKQIVAGFNAGAWTGNGVTSSSAAADTSKAVGYALSSEVAGPAGGPFAGATVDGSGAVARYTLAGDATLDGTVDFNDLVKLAQNYNTTVSDITESWWNKGDFTYDGITDFNDLVKLAQNYNSALPSEPIPGASAGFEADLARAFASVPEPGTISLLALGAIGLLAGRRRK
jgi:hypothetical protein